MLHLLINSSDFILFIFTEEFNFEVMNKKFKKDELWGALGKLHKKDRAETEDSYVSPCFGSRERIGLTGKPNTTVGIGIYVVSLICAYAYC